MLNSLELCDNTCQQQLLITVQRFISFTSSVNFIVNFCRLRPPLRLTIQLLERDCNCFNFSTCLSGHSTDGVMIKRRYFLAYFVNTHVYCMFFVSEHHSNL